MKRPVILMIFLLVVQFVMAQDKVNRPKVMIIPFDPDMYFSDADQDLAKYNTKNIKEIRTMFRMGLNSNINAKVLSEYDTRSMLSDTSKDSGKDLYAIYKGISYYEEKSKPDPNTPAPKKEDGLKKLFEKKDNKEGQNTSRLTKTDKDGLHTYMNVKIYDNKMLEYLHNKYGTDLFLFLNQFNLVTDFAKCLDRSTNTFEREMAVHYSIFDYSGQQLAGDVAIVKFPSNSNDMMTIIKTNFPIISDYIAGKLPSHIKRPLEQPEAKETK